MRGYVCFELTEAAKEKVLSLFPPFHKIILCDHVTHSFDVENSNLPDHPDYITIYGYAKNDKVESLVVHVEEQTHRPDGKLYHLTLSHSPKGRPVMSNDLISEGWDSVHKTVLKSSDFKVKFNPF